MISRVFSTCNVIEAISGGPIGELDAAVGAEAERDSGIVRVIVKYGIEMRPP